MEFIKNFSKNYWPLFILIILSFLLPAIWLREGLAIGYNEYGLTFLMDQSKILNSNVYSWNHYFGLGIDNSYSLQTTPYFLITTCLQFLGLSLVIIQYTTFSFIILISALSMYLVTVELIHNKNNYKLIGLFASLFYILNPFTINVWHRFVSSIFCLPLVPLTFLLAIKIIKNPSFKYAFSFAITILIFSICAINPAFFIPSLLPAIFYIILKIISEKKIRLNRLKYLGVTILLTILLNIWWLIGVTPLGWTRC